MADQEFTEEAAAVAVQGWGSTPCTFIERGAPPVIVNPEAMPIDMLDWAIGQPLQAQTLMKIIGCSQSDIEVEPAEVVDAFRHQVEQALAVLQQAIHRLQKEVAHG